MLYRYRDAFSLRNDRGTWPYIQVKIDVTDKFPSSLRSYYAK